MKKVLIINGPNLNMLGDRETGIYGKLTLSDIEREISERATAFEPLFFQSNHEGEIIDFIHANIKADAMLINPAAFSHYSVAILDALRSFSGFIIEVHLSNVFDREEYRKRLLTAEAADALILGLGADSYYVAVEQLNRILRGD